MPRTVNVNYITKEVKILLHDSETESLAAATAIAAAESAQEAKDVVVDSLQDSLDAIDAKTETEKTELDNYTDTKKTEISSFTTEELQPYVTAAAASAQQADTTATALTTFLETKETLTAPAVDTTLSVSGAAAESKTVGDIKKELIKTTDLLGTTDFFEKIGKVDATLNSNGTVSASTSYKTTADFVPVTAGDVLSIVFEGGTPYTPKICTYDSSKVLVEYRNSTLAASTNWTIPDGVSYFKISVSNAVYNGGISIRMKKSNWEHIYRYLKADDLISKAGVVYGYLNNDGTTTASSTMFVTADYIPVTPGGRIELLFGGTAAYTPRIGFYDENKSFISLNQSNRNPIDYVEITDNVYYIKISFSKNVSDAGFVAKNEINDIKRLISCVKSLDLLSFYGMSKGALNDDGMVLPSVAYFTSSDYIPVESGETIEFIQGIKNAYTPIICTYDQNKDLVNFSRKTIPYVYNLTIPDGVSYFKISVSNAVYNGGISAKRVTTDWESVVNKLTEVSSKNKVYKYSGEKLDLDIEGFKVWKLWTWKNLGLPSGSQTEQAFAIFGNTLFQFCADDGCKVYKFPSFELVGTFNLICEHGNTASFSNQYLNPGSEFPLLYLSSIVNEIYVHDITKVGSTLIRTLSFPTNIVGYTAQGVVDGDTLYTIGSARNEVSLVAGDELIVCKYNLNDLTQNQDGSFTPAFIESFRVTISAQHLILQGCQFLNGKIYIASGGHNVSYTSVFVIDVNTERFVTALESFPSEIKSHELEGIAFDLGSSGSRYDMILYLRNYAYYRLVF